MQSSTWKKMAAALLWLAACDDGAGTSGSGGEATGGASTGAGPGATGAVTSGAGTTGPSASATGSTGPGASSSSGAGGGLVWTEGFLIDHTSVALFDQIPPEYLEAARNTPMLFSDRSVGQNINEALDCLTADGWAQSPASCRRDYIDADWNTKLFTQADLDANQVPSRILFDADPVIYDRSNWTFEYRQGEWSPLTQDFIESLGPQYLPTKQILGYQFSYLNVTPGGDIAHPTNGFFADVPNRYDVHDLEAFMGANPDKVFVLWTTSLARGIGTQEATTFNDAMRAYAAQAGRILFDVADIESHTDTGVPCYDNRDGVEYCGTNDCENYPDDGVALPAICQDYTTEIDGGHLGSVSAGKILIAKAFWVLMARAAGWQP
jgi:hypothetical protein